MSIVTVVRLVVACLVSRCGQIRRTPSPPPHPESTDMACYIFNSLHPSYLFIYLPFHQPLHLVFHLFISLFINLFISLLIKTYLFLSSMQVWFGTFSNTCHLTLHLSYQYLSFFLVLCKFRLVHLQTRHLFILPFISLHLPCNPTHHLPIFSSQFNAYWIDTFWNLFNLLFLYLSFQLSLTLSSSSIYLFIDLPKARSW